MLMTTEMTTLHRNLTAFVALHIEHTHKNINWERTSWARSLVPCAQLIALHIGPSFEPCPHLIHIVIHVSVVSLTRFTPLSTSQLSSCPSSSSPTYTSAKLLYQLVWWGQPATSSIIHHKIRWVKIVNTFLRWTPGTIETFAKLSVNQPQSLTLQSQTCVKSTNPFPIERGKPCGRVMEFLIHAKRDKDRSSFGLWWPTKWRSFSATVWRTSWKAITDKINWVNSVWPAGSLSVMENGRYFITKDTGDLTQFQHSGLSWIHLFREKIQHHNRKDGSKRTPKLGPCWKLQPATFTINKELRSKLCLRVEKILTLGSEFLVDHQGL